MLKKYYQVLHNLDVIVSVMLHFIIWYSEFVHFRSIIFCILKFRKIWSSWAAIQEWIWDGNNKTVYRWWCTVSKWNWSVRWNQCFILIKTCHNGLIDLPFFQEKELWLICVFRGAWSLSDLHIFIILTLILEQVSDTRLWNQGNVTSSFWST